MVMGALAGLDNTDPKLPGQLKRECCAINTGHRNACKEALAKVEKELGIYPKPRGPQ
jgi:hypothetical protein